jgi:hypothetical protein
MTTKTKHATTAGRKAISSPTVERKRLTSQKDKAKVNVRPSKDKPRNSAAKAKANLKVGGAAPRNGTTGALPGTQLLRILLQTGLATLPTIHLLLKAKKEVKDKSRVMAGATIGLVISPAITMALTLISIMTPLLIILTVPLNPLSGTLGRIRTPTLILASLFLSLRMIS